MIKIDKKYIDIACYQTRLCYTDLNYCINNNNIKNLTLNDKFIIIYDMSYVLSIFKRLASIENDSELDKDSITYIVYGILNSVAHYRHYITRNLHCKSVVIIYSSNEIYYNDFSKIMELIQKILNLFHKTIFIEKLDKEQKFLYQHLCYFTCMNITISNSTVNKKCRIIYIGNNNLSLQLLRIDRDAIFIKHKFIDFGINVFYNFINNNKNIIISHHITDLISVMLSILGFKHGFPKLNFMKRMMNIKIYNTIVENCKNIDIIDKDNYLELIKGLPLSDSEKNIFGLRLKMLDADFQNKTFILSKSLFKIWTNKIHSKSIYSLNDIINNNDIELQVNWLNGG